MFGILLILSLGVLVASQEIGMKINFPCQHGSMCIPFTECTEVKEMVDNTALLEYARSLVCGYFHKPYVCCFRQCMTPNANYGKALPLNQCPHLKEITAIGNERQRDFLEDSYINNTHVCCNSGEDAYIPVPPAPVDRPNIAPRSQECTTPNGEHGKCVQVSECSAYEQNVGANDEDFRFVNDSFCGYWQEPMICCGDASDYKENYVMNLPDNKDCGLWDATVGSRIPPWLALMKGPTKECIGALINREYVLAAVDCVGNGSAILSVRFGECINDETNKDCSYQAMSSKIFPLYTYLHSEDLGLALLKLTIPPSSVIGFMPVCLPTDDLSDNEDVSIIGLRKDRSVWLGSTVLTSTIRNDDCKLPPYMRLVCLQNREMCRDYEDRLQHFVLKIDGGRWYLQGLFNKQKCYGPANDIFYVIYVHKYMSWINSNVS